VEIVVKLSLYEQTENCTDSIINRVNVIIL